MLMKSTKARSAVRGNRRDALPERLAQGRSALAREQVRAVLAYAEWKLSGISVLAHGCIQEDAKFLTRRSCSGDQRLLPRSGTARKTVHSSSVSKLRMKAALRPKEQPRIKLARVGGIPRHRLVHVA
jgi:hypothetical protein